MDTGKLDETTLFRSAVLSGILIIVLLLHKKHPYVQIANWRNGTLVYMDRNGRQGEEAKSFRHDVTYPTI